MPDGSAEAAELEAKLAFDQASALLAAQRTDLKELQSKAKDLIGLLTLATTFLSAFGKAYADTVLKQLKDQPLALTVILVALPVVTAVAALYVMTPNSKWMFNLDGASIKLSMQNRKPNVKFADPRAFYLGYTAVFSRLGADNEKMLRHRKYGVWIATISLVATIGYTGGLVLASTPGP
ncbi:hypothetical protein A5706_15660 [Mycobacterium sp. E796]|nr:hypothetical protein A5706_15660 [Mycobacterium sp. E796]